MALPLEYLRQLGVAPPTAPVRPRGPVEELLADYCRYLLVERGLCDHTVFDAARPRGCSFPGSRPRSNPAAGPQHATHIGTANASYVGIFSAAQHEARYHATRAERRYRAVDPDNRLVARGLETEWNTALQQVADAEAELARREITRPKSLTRPSGARSWPSATTSARCGTRRPPPTKTASSCCAPCWKR